MLGLCVSTSQTRCTHDQHGQHANFPLRSTGRPCDRNMGQAQLGVVPGTKVNGVVISDCGERPVCGFHLSALEVVHLPQRSQPSRHSTHSAIHLPIGKAVLHNATELDGLHTAAPARRYVPELWLPIGGTQPTNRESEGPVLTVI